MTEWWKKDHKIRILAPMVGICTSSYRTMAIENGADIVFTEELVSKRLCQCRREVKGDYIQYIDKEDIMLTLRQSEESKTVLQLGTFDDESSLKSAELIKEVCGIDINLGCGMGFSTKGEMGQALVPNRTKLSQIIQKLKTVNKPISAKIRLQSTTKETIDFIRWLQNEGICLITLHGRRHKQFYTNDCDWNELQTVVKDLFDLTSEENFNYCPELKEIKNSEKLQHLKDFPIILNGDICMQEDITTLSNYSPNVKGIMIGRASGIHLGLFSPTGGNFIFNKTKLFKTMFDFILRAQKEQLTFKKIKFVLLQLIKYQKDYPYGRWRVIDKETDEKRKKTNLQLTQINSELSKCKTIEAFIQFIGIDEKDKNDFSQNNLNENEEKMLNEKNINL